MSSELTLILDDASGQFNYSGGQLSGLAQWYNKTSFYPGFAGDETQFGSFTLTFEGTSVAFIGNTPQTVSSLSQLATVTIDGGQPYNITYGNLDPPSYIQWYQSPTLADGSHTISLDRLAGTAVDFALINVGPKTSLSGKTIFVDDNDSAINYAGHWTRNTDRFIPGTLLHGYPAGNTTRTSSTPGDTITFRFFGSSLSVYGIFSWADLGVMSAAYSLDGNIVTKTLSVTTSTPQYVNNYGQASNVLLFSDNTIQPGDHTLIIIITQCINQAFTLDYITYSPSFSSLAAMPNLTNTPTSAANVSTTSTTQPASITQAQLITIMQPISVLITKSVTKLITEPPAALQTNNSRNDMRTETNNIVGSVVGGIAIILIVICLLFFARRRGNGSNSQDNPNAAQTQHVRVLPQVIQLLPLPPVSRRGLATIRFGLNPGQTVSPFPLGSPTHHGSGPAIDRKRSRANFENEQRFRNIVLGIGPQNDHSSRGNTNSILPADLDTNNFVDSELPSYDALPTNHPFRRVADDSISSSHRTLELLD